MLRGPCTSLTTGLIVLFPKGAGQRKKNLGRSPKPVRRMSLDSTACLDHKHGRIPGLCAISQRLVKCSALLGNLRSKILHMRTLKHAKSRRPFGRSKQGHCSETQLKRVPPRFNQGLKGAFRNRQPAIDFKGASPRNQWLTLASPSRNPSRSNYLLVMVNITTFQCTNAACWLFMALLLLFC